MQPAVLFRETAQHKTFGSTYAVQTDDVQYHFSPVSTPESTLACPTHLLNVLLKQTNLDESSIHARYIKFREKYPTGYIGSQVFRDLCNGILGPNESQKFSDLVFGLYGCRRNGSGANTRTSFIIHRPYFQPLLGSLFCRLGQSLHWVQGGDARDREHRESGRSGQGAALDLQSLRL